jgi:DNA-binding beta-propeller fold protein YncE
VPLEHTGFIELPAHAKSGGFDHAAVHEPTGRIYVAHTANDAIDVIDIEAQKYVDSIPGIPAVAGALVAEASDLVFTSNRGENTVGVFAPVERPAVEKIGVGIRPNGRAYDRGRRRLLVAHVGDPLSPVRVPCRSSTFGPAGGSPICRSPAAPGGRSTIRPPTHFTSTSPIPRRSS